MKKTFVALSAVTFGMATLGLAQGQAAPAAGPAKVAIIHVQNAIMSTKDGQKAAGDLQTKFGPKKQELEKKQADITALQDQLRRGSATMSEEAKAKLMRDIDSNQKSLQRETEDAQADLDQENQKIMQDLGNKIMDVIIKYATQNGYTMVVDVSNPQTPVLWAAPEVDITQDIVKLYDQAHPGGTAATPAPAATRTSAPAKPPAAPPVKKQ